MSPARLESIETDSFVFNQGDVIYGYQCILVMQKGAQGACYLVSDLESKQHHPETEQLYVLKVGPTTVHGGVVSFRL